MEVSSVETIPVEVPVRGRDEQLGIAPYVTGTSLEDLPEALSFEEALDAETTSLKAARKLLIRLETTDGTVGWGELKVPSMELGQTIIEELIEPELVGRHLNSKEAFVAEFDSFNSRFYVDLTAYLGVVEMAMWDAHGKALGKPVYELIGGAETDEVPVAFCLGLLSPEDSAKHAQQALDAGFSVLKTKGSRYWKTDVRRIKAIHDAVDGELELRLDPNQLWSIEDAVRVGAALEDAGIYIQYLEQPIRIDSAGTMKRLRQRLQTPIAVNEDAYFKRNIYQLGREDAIDAAVIDTIPAGGILGIKRLAGLAREMGISLAHHSNFDLGIKNAAKLHVWTSTPNFNLPIDSVYYALEGDVLNQRLEVSNGRMQLPSDPGLARVNSDRVDQYRID